MTVKSSFSSLLIETAKAGFPSPYRAERLLLQNFVGQQNPASAATGVEGESREARKDGSKWGRDREVRAGLIRMLCTSRVAQAFADPHGINVDGAKITGALDLARISIPFPIILQNCYFDATPRFSEANVPELNLEKSFAPGLDAELITVKGHLSLQNFTSEKGEINLRLCHLTGNLTCSGGTFSNPDRMNPQGKPDEESGMALAADGAIIDGYVLLRTDSDKPFHSEGEVRFFGAQIRGDIDCSGGKFNHPKNPAYPDRGVALTVAGVNVKGSVLLQEGFEAQGEVSLVDAQIGGSLYCTGGHFENKTPGGASEMASALALDRASVAGSALFTDDNAKRHCQVIGYLSLVNARIGGVLSMDGADMRSATVDLSGASASGFSDRGDNSWPHQGYLHLKRFVYAGIVGDTEKAEDRLEWLGLQPANDFNTESYAQLANVLTQRGDDEGARLVLQRLAELRAKRDHPYWYLRPEIWFKASIGYFYDPMRAIWYGLFLGLTGWIIYRRSYLAGTLVPTDKDAYSKLRDEGALPPYYPRLSSFMMSVENSLPLVKLGQADKWQPDPGELREASSSVLTEKQDGLSESEATVKKYSRALLFAPIRRMCTRALMEVGLQPGPTGKSTDSPLSRRGTSPQFLRRFVWIQILLGWLFATLFVAGVSGLLKK